MKLKQVYLKAARRIAEKEDIYSCLAIMHAILGPYSQYLYEYVPIARDYHKVFGFSNSSTFQIAIEESNDDIKCRNLRVWLLCLAAAMCENS